MIQLVLDTSVVLKWIRQEEILAEQALDILHGYLEGHIRVIVPTLLIYEVANVLRYKVEFTTMHLETAIQSLFNLDLEWVVASSEIARRSVNLARVYDTSVYDAVFAAVAEGAGATLVTADVRLVQRLERLSYVVFLGEIANHLQLS
ncbi:MAG: type II toxin-antitoxin system VapC family toxin [Anaerolineae bacterium]|nr:type II toxin-antitoxin system VapC family toxin [Anaerolineae bacterium]